MLGSQIGSSELIVVLVIVLLIFGPKKLPDLAKAIGRSINDFKRGLSGVDDQLREELEKEKPAAPAQKPAAQIEAEPAVRSTSTEKVTETRES